jgi:predicted HTH domain antitoxin
MTTIAIPRDVLNSMKIPRSDQEHVLKLELALALYQRGILAMGPARRLADISKREFLGELGKTRLSLLRDFFQEILVKERFHRSDMISMFWGKTVFGLAKSFA